MPRAPFLLDPEVAYLNHGAYGSCPRPVFEEYQAWQRELEHEPVDLFERRLEGELARVRAVLGEYVGAPADDLALVLNATAGVNAVLRSLRLRPGDEILTTEHEYGAVNLLLEFLSERTGVRVVRGPGLDAESIWSAASARTRVLLVSHITSPTALLLPVEELAVRAAAAGVLTVVDGAHGPGHVPLALERLGADFYAGNCHKWLCAPKGAGFLYARPDRQSLLDPLVAGWGYGSGGFAVAHDWNSTRDPSAYLAVPAAVEFVRRHGEQKRCRALLRETAARVEEAGFAPVGPPQPLQMASFRLPSCDPEEVQGRLREEWGVEAPVRRWRDETLVRVSVAPYTTHEDVDRLLEALRALLGT